MTKKYSTKRALIASILALCMCFTMLIGTTFAWFTDSVTSSGNVIQTGTLDVAMYWAEGDEDPTAVSEWTDASTGAIFNNDKWEPGYSEAKHIKIANEGTLALKYQMRILANGVVSELADVIDVYYFDDAKQLSRADFVDANKLGTLTEVLNAAHAKNISNTIAGSLESGKTKTVTLAFKMQEGAGNEYQNLSIGTDFSIQLLATQYTSENDSFDNLYDDDASFPAQEVPAANVFILNQSKLSGITAGTTGAALDVGYSFQPTETEDEVEGTEKANWHADFFVYADATVPAESMALAGYYNAFNGLNFNGQTLSETNWIALTSPSDIAAGEANGVRLIESMGVSVPYLSVCEYGNDGTGFLCGAADLTGANAGTTLTVELRLYKTYTEEECLEKFGYKSANEETGEYITVGKFTYTFGGAYTTLADGSEVFMADDGGVWLTSVADVTSTEYYVPDGVTELSGGVFSTNTNVKTVVLSNTISDFGATGVSATNASGGAFKGSAVETVVLPEGMTEIPAAAFNGAKNLTSVNIPSTVETIGVNAFRQTAIAELTVPATVETVSCGAFRDMTALTTVTVEGNVAFENYAFRSVPNLTSIYLLGDDVTFNGSQFATHSDNGNATGITIYVANATVAARVYAAQASAYGYEVKVLGTAADGSDAGEVAQAKTQANLETAISDGADTIILGSGEYTMPASAKNQTITIAGNGETSVKVVDSGASEGDIDYSLEGANVTFENVTIKMQGTDYPGYARIASATYNNCTFEGANYCLYGDSVFNNCTFNLTNGYVWTWGASNVEFNNCTFETTDGSSKAILVHNNGVDTVVTVKDCTFIGNKASYTWDGLYVAAVSIDPATANKATVNFVGTNTVKTADGATADANGNVGFAGLYQYKYAIEASLITVTVDGETVENIIATDYNPDL